jgi:hypothetical protein
MSKWGALKGGSTAKKEDEKVIVPFDLDKIFSLSYGFEPLKEVLQDIYGKLGKNEKDVNNLDMKLTTKFMEISQ